MQIYTKYNVINAEMNISSVSKYLLKENTLIKAENWCKIQRWSWINLPDEKNQTVLCGFSIKKILQNLFKVPWNQHQIKIKDLYASNYINWTN